MEDRVRAARLAETQDERSMRKGQDLKAWRIARKTHPLFSGEGARIVGGRWNSPGRPVIYAASSFSLSVLEILVHVQRAGLEDAFAYIEIDIPASVTIEHLSNRAIALDSVAAREFGDRWLSEQRSAILFVPSVVVAVGDKNVLINPDHPNTRLIKHHKPGNVEWDVRLFR